MLVRLKSVVARFFGTLVSTILSTILRDATPVSEETKRGIRQAERLADKERALRRASRALKS